MPIEITVKDNSYISLEDANNYFNTRLNNLTWENVNDTEKKKALITATRHIDYNNFIGRKVNPDQPLEFPRIFSKNINPFYEYDDKLDSDNLPKELLDATCEEAIALLNKNNKIEEKQRNGIESESIQDTSRSYNSDIMKSKRQGRGLISPEAKSLLRGFIKSTVRLG